MALVALGLLGGCRGQGIGGWGKPALTLTSTSIVGGKVARKCTCDGASSSPALAWSAPPLRTVSLALIVTDPDAPDGTFVHWVLYDLPAELRQLPEGMPKAGLLPDSSRQGRNDFGDIGYGGPCPPGRAAHRYIFALYALDSRLNLPGGATRSQVEAAMKGHILAQGKLVGLYPG
ncbi:MAG: YbhB/YbcL family Raf kinase inhibitor-like protein [Terracidiphilus sp.]